ncbi:hypothetical protein COO60DRAFT_1458497 [Scenedesmus sp. NREL 46B-D3]|nr:hypothetical protein COO60DRAFT_1458497 [Scenedesmus sp. NREL 46B-D3]
MLQAEDLDERNVAELRKFDAALRWRSWSTTARRTSAPCATGAHTSQVRPPPAASRRAEAQVALGHPVSAAPRCAAEAEPAHDCRLHQGGDLDKRCMDALASLPPGKAIAVLERYGSKDFSEVRNPSALFMSTVKTIAGPDASAAGGGGYGAPGSHRLGDRGHHAPSNGSYGSSGAAAVGPTPRSYPGYPSLGPPDRAGGSYNSYEDGQPPPPPPRQQQYAAAGGLGALGVLGAAAAAGPASADGLSLLAGGAVLQQPGMQLVAPAGLAGVAPGMVIMAAGVGGVQQQYIVSAGGMLTPVPAGATVIGGAPGAGYAVQVAAPAAAAAAPPAGVPPEWAASRKQYGLEQGQLGVRTAEFHGLSPFAGFVHPSPALKLQQLWDDGNELVRHSANHIVGSCCACGVSVACGVCAYGWHEGGDDHYGSLGGGFHGAFRGGFRGRGRGPPGGGRGGGYHGDDGDIDGGGFRQATPRAPGIHLLPPAQRAKAEELCRDHAPLLRHEHFDEGVVATLERLPHDDALAVLDELGGNSMAGVRNLPAYIMGICKRYIRGEAGAGAAGGGRGGGRAPGLPAAY